MVKGIIGTILIGFLIGLIAHFIKPASNREGLNYTSFVGMVGALVGRFLGQAMGIYRGEEPAAYIGAVVGATIILALINVTTPKDITPHQ